MPVLPRATVRDSAFLARQWVRRRLRQSARVKSFHLWYAEQDMALEDLTPADWSIIQRAKQHHLGDAAGLYGLIQAVDHVERRGIEGAFVECGVARGGAAMAMALRLLQRGGPSRDLYLFDTFTGCPAPTEEDGMVYGGRTSQEVWEAALRDPAQRWFQPLEEVARRNVASTGYPAEYTHLVVGLVEETVPDLAPDKIAILRLDTDWYASTQHEMAELYPRLQSGGVLVVDDYGTFEGSRRAVNEFFERTGQPQPLLSRVTFGVRMGTKP